MYSKLIGYVGNAKISRKCSIGKLHIGTCSYWTIEHNLKKKQRKKPDPRNLDD